MKTGLVIRFSEQRFSVEDMQTILAAHQMAEETLVGSDFITGDILLKVRGYEFPFIKEGAAYMCFSPKEFAVRYRGSK